MSSTFASTCRGLLLALALALGPGCSSPAGGQDPAGPRDRAMGSEDAPGGPTVHLLLQAIDGGIIDTAHYRGEPIVLHFFTVGSLASQADTEQLIALHDQRGESVRIIAVSMEDTDYPTLAGWRRGSDVEYLVAVPSDALRAGRTSLGRIEQIPTTVVLDRRGRLVERFDGPLSPPALKSRLDALQ